MRYLHQFQSFAWGKFITGKVMLCTGQRPWVDHDTGAVLGTEVEAVIYHDDTAYKRKEEDTRTNRFEKLTFKVSKTVTVPVDSQILPIDAVATVWGEFRNNLSVRANDIEVVPQRQASTKGA